jgi:hypothetical protein
LQTTDNLIYSSADDLQPIYLLYSIISDEKLERCQKILSAKEKLYFLPIELQNSSKDRTKVSETRGLLRKIRGVHEIEYFLFDKIDFTAE